jgi:uncharacterized protein (UPF0548 family)
MISARTATAPFEEEYWRSKPLSVDLAHGKTGTHDQYSIALSLDSRERSFERASSALFRYHVFPPNRMRAHVCTADGRIAIGATIIQRILLGPIAMEMGVRVVDIVDHASGLRQAGFTYATLEGHSERGIATFSVRERVGEPSVFEIESWSTPGTLVAWLSRPVARWAQRSFTREALLHFRDHFQEG